MIRISDELKKINKFRRLIQTVIKKIAPRWALVNGQDSNM